MKIKIENARLSFPSLFSTSKFGGEDTGKYEATFILDKKQHKKLIETIEAEIDKVIKTELKGKHPGEDRVCLKDGDDADRPEMAGKMTLKASTKKRPLVIDRDKTPLTEDDNKPYAGCYVNAYISLWAQNNSWGKRINAQLEGVQFFGDGDPFGTPGIDVDDFECLDEF